MNADNPIFIAATWIIPLVIAITFHEVAHGMVAHWFGDPTAKLAGRLTFNPVRHIDPMGTVVLPLMLAVSGAPLFGWAKPVPVRTNLLRNPRWHGVLVTAAGPFMNFALALIGAAVFAVTLTLSGGGERGMPVLFLLANLYNFVAINLFLGIFNLLPIPPLDGGHVLTGLLPPSLGRQFARVGRYGLGILILLLIVLPMLSPSLDIVAKLVNPPVRMLTHALFHLFVG